MFYICNYSDYTDLPDKLFCENSPDGSYERKSLDGTKFVSRCELCTPTNGCLSWMNGSEPSFTHSEILIELQKPEWLSDED